MRKDYMPAMFVDIALLPAQMPGVDLRAKVNSNHPSLFDILPHMDQAMAEEDPFLP